MKILVTLDFPPEQGGIQRHLHGVAAHAYGRNDLVLAGCASPPALPAAGCTVPVTYVSTPLSRFNKKWSLFPLVARLLVLRLKKGRGLMVECGNVYAGLVPWLLSFVMPVNYRVYAHGTEIGPLSGKSAVAAVLRAVLAKAETIHANSAYTETAVRSLGIRTPVTIVSPKIELPDHLRNRKTGTTALKKETGVVTILCVGRLVPHKGQAVLLDAASKLPESIDWRIVVAGNGPLLPVLREQCSRLGIAGLVEIKTGLIDHELEKEYTGASLFVLPSVAQGGIEGFGIVLLEAMAQRLPIIASDTGGVPEVLENGSCGLLVPPGDPVALAAAIARVAGDGTLAQGLVSRAWERLVRLYVWH